MLTFDAIGHLTPAESIISTVSEIENCFVSQMTNSTIRLVLFNQLQDLLRTFATEISDTFTMWIDGSFVTVKADPNDIDIVIFLNYATYDAFGTKLDIFKHKRLFSNIDCYIERVYPVDHVHYVRYQSDLAYWHSLFTRNRKKQYKGYLSISFQP